MIRSACVASLFCFSFITSPLLCSDRQNKGRKNKPAEATSATNNANVTPLVIHPQEAPITPTQVTSPRNSSPLSSPRRLSRRSSAGSVAEEEPLSPQLHRSTTATQNQAFGQTQTTTAQTTSSTSSTAAPTAISTPVAPASTTQTTTSTSSTSSTAIKTGQEASSSNVTATLTQLTQSTSAATTSSTAIITNNSNAGPRLEATWWTWAQEKTEGLRYDRTVVLTSLRNKTFRDRFHTPMLKFTKIGNAINEILVEEDKRGKDDLLLRCDELVDGAKEHDVEILAAQKRDILTRVDTKIQRLQALRAKLI